MDDGGDITAHALTIRLLRIDETTRQSEDDWWVEWELVRPRVLGALLDAIVAAVRTYDTTKLAKIPRMAAFAKLMASVETALGWSTGDFMSAYDANRQATTDAVFESDPVAVAIHRMMMKRDVQSQTWEGTATMLLAELNELVGDEARRSKFWPAKVNALGNAVDRAAPLLRHKGVQVTKRSTGAQRLITTTANQVG